MNTQRPIPLQVDAFSPIRHMIVHDMQPITSQSAPCLPTKTLPAGRYRKMQPRRVVFSCGSPSNMIGKGYDGLCSYVNATNLNHVREQSSPVQVADRLSSLTIFSPKKESCLFLERNKNIVTIDLHGQHAKEALVILKRHLLVLSCTPFVDSLRVITGHGETRVAKGKIKLLVKSFIIQENIDYIEENLGCFLLKIGPRKDFQFASKIIPNEHDRNDWRTIIRMLQCDRGYDSNSKAMPPIRQESKVDGDGYTEYRTIARQNWDLMRTYHERAVMEGSRGNLNHAVYLTETAKYYRKLACEEDKRASSEIFYARNRGFRNAVTINIDGHHIERAMALFKQHLLLFSFAQSIHYLRVIMSGRMGDLMQLVKELAIRENIPLAYENPWTIVLMIHGIENYTFAEVVDGDVRSSIIVKAADSINNQALPRMTALIQPNSGICNMQSSPIGGPFSGREYGSEGGIKILTGDVYTSTHWRGCHFF